MHECVRVRMEMMLASNPFTIHGAGDWKADAFMETLNNFRGDGWDIRLAPDWVAEHAEECVTICHPEGVGALQISAYTKSTDISQDDLRELASEHVDEGAILAAVNAGVFSGFTLAYGVDGEFWQYWYLAAGKQALFVTYVCDENDRSKELAEVRSMVASLAVA